MRKSLFAAAAFVAAVAVLVVFSLPPRRLALPAQPDGSVAGILHVHTNESDGLSSPDDIAAAAARVGLKFVVFTDHGDATRKPDPPQYRSGVLCLDGVEISTTGGHYIALDMPAAPYPLGGEPRDVVEDVRRLGGFGIAAHPDSPKPQLRWRDWTAPFDAIEIVNLDTSWRQWMEQARGSASEPGAPTPWAARRRLFAALVAYAFRPSETIGGLVRTGGVINQWATLAARRRVVMLAGADAHAKLGLRSDPADSSLVLPFPSYESAFRTMSIHVAAGNALTGDAAADAATLVAAIRAGHAYTSLDSAATPPSFEFSAVNGRGTARAGDELLQGGPVTLHVRTNAPPAFATIVWNGAARLGGEHHEPEFTVNAPDGPGVYWVEVRAATPSTVAWITSNPIYIRAAAAAPGATSARPPTMTQAIFDGRVATGWAAEHDATSLAAVDLSQVVAGGELRFRFGLAGGAPVGQVAALADALPRTIGRSDRVTFTIRAEHPMRIFVQLRASDAAADRWSRSIFVDTTDQEHTVFFDDMMPVGQTGAVRPVLSNISHLLFVVDTTNTAPGTSGRIWLKNVLLQGV